MACETYSDFTYLCSWQFQYYSKLGGGLLGTCWEYPPHFPIDGAWRASRGLAGTAYFFGTVAFVALLSSTAVSLAVTFTSRHLGRLEGLAETRAEVPLILLAALFNGLTLAFLGGSACDAELLRGYLVEYEEGAFFDVGGASCALTAGGKLAVSATFFWTAALVPACASHLAGRGRGAEKDVVVGWGGP